MKPPATLGVNKHSFWKLAGAFTFVICFIPWLLFTGACNCCGSDCDTPPPPAECMADPNGTEVRTIEVFDAVFSNEDVGPRVALVSGDEMARVAGFQGSDMVTSQIRIGAGTDTEPEGTERCIQVSYVGVSMDFTSDLIFVRQGDYWVLEQSIFDPIEDGVSFTQTITVRDAVVTGSSALMLSVL